VGDFINIFDAIFWMGFLSRILLLASHRWRASQVRLPVVHVVTFLIYAASRVVIFPEMQETYWEAMTRWPIIASALFWLIAYYLFFVPKLKL
jgi:hypothetical protein